MAVLIALVMMMAGARPAVAAEVGADVDIVGLKLGMTADEAIAALRAHNPGFSLHELSLDVTIADSNRKPLKVARYVKEVRGIWDQGVKGHNLNAPLWKDQIVVIFAPPPADHRVQHIRRIVRYHPGKGPDFDGVVNSIAQKYGEPTQSRKQSKTSLMQLWLHGGKRLSDTQYLNWFNRSKISIDLDRPGTEGGTQIEDSRHLGVYLVAHGHGLFTLGSILSESKKTMNERNEATRVMANAALDAHEAKLRQETKGRKGPAL
jgi:hypothetical protein